MNNMQPSELIKKKPGSEKTSIELAQEYGELLIKGPFDNNWVDKVRQLNKEFSVSDKRIKPFLDLVGTHIDPQIRFQLVNILLQETYTDPKTFLRGNCFARDVFLYYNDGAEFNNRVERFMNYDPECITNITNDIPDRILQQFAALNIPPENLYKIFSFNYINPKFMRALEEKKIKDPNLTLLAAACGEIIGKKNVLKDLDTSETKTGTLDKLRKQAKTPPQLDAINSVEPKIRKLITGMHNAGVEAQFVNITDRYKKFLGPNPEKNVIPVALSETQREENFQKFKVGLNPPTSKQSLRDRVKESFLVNRLSSAWTTFKSSVQSAWKSVTSIGSNTKSDVDVSKKAPLTQVTSSGENQSEVKKSNWVRFKDLVTSTFASPKVSETSQSNKTGIGGITNPGKLTSSKKSMSDSGKPEVTFAGMQSLENSYQTHPPFEMQLKSMTDKAISNINIIQKYCNFDTQGTSGLIRDALYKDFYNALEENIKALAALNNTENARELMLINLAQQQILSHLEKCIQEQDKKINDPVNSQQSKELLNTRDALLYVRDKLAQDFNFNLPEDARYVSVEKPEQVIKRFAGENYQAFNSKAISESDLQKINGQLSDDLKNIKEKVDANSGKSSPEIRKALMELHLNLNAFKDRVKEFVPPNSDLQNAYGEKGGVKDQYLSSVKDIEDQAIEINKQMLGADKKTKW